MLHQANYWILVQKRIYAIFLIALIVWFFLATNSVYAGFGVSPPLIREDRLVPGSQIEREIVLVQGNPEIDVPVEVTIESKNIKDWIRIRETNNFIIPKDTQQFPMGVMISVPQDADLGVYRANLRIGTSAKKTEEAGSVSIAIGGFVEIELTVGDDIIEEFDIKNIKILNIKEGKPLKISLAVINTGNVPTAPDTASFELFNKFGDVRLGFVEVGDFEKIPAFSEAEIEKTFPLDLKLAPGEYWGHVKIYNEKGSEIKNLRTVFNVKKKTFLDIILIPLLIAGGVLFVGGAYSLIKGKRRLNRKRVSKQTPEFNVKKL